jgi:hypothetical protein
MNPGAGTPVAALTRAAAVAAMVILAVSSAGAAHASQPLGQAAGPSARPPASQLTRLDVGGSQLAGRGVVVNYPSPQARRLPRVPASAFVIADAATGQVLAARDPHGFFPPASTLKVLTAITMIPLLDPAASVVASHRATAVEPTVVGLVTGRSYQIGALFKALLLISANDAAVALAQASGSFDRGVALMNAQAHRLQAYDVAAERLLNWGFSMDGKVRPVGMLVPPLRGAADSNGTASSPPGAAPGSADPGPAGRAGTGGRAGTVGLSGTGGTGGPSGTSPASGARRISADLAVGTGLVAVIAIGLVSLLARSRRLSSFRHRRSG